MIPKIICPLGANRIIIKIIPKQKTGFDAVRYQRKYIAMTEPDYDELNCLDFRFLLRLKANMLNAFMDASYQMDVLERIRKQMKKENGKALIFRSLNPGVAHIYSEMSIDRYFQDLAQFGYIDMMYGFYDVTEDLKALDSAWSLIGGCGNRTRVKHSKKIYSLLEKLDANNDVDIWTDLLREDGVKLFEDLAAKCHASRDYKNIRSSYAAAMTDSILHDRQLCAFIAHKLLDLAPMDKEKNKIKYVNRTKWPSHVVRIVIARDRGKCSQCHTDITMELMRKPNIDHIFALAKGGCNDIVNLQLLCEKCNSRKGSRDPSVMTSIPGYTNSEYIVFGDEF